MAKVLISFPDELLRRVDAEARRRGTSRSALLQDAALRELGRADPDAIEAALRRGREALAGAGAFEAAELIRAQRDALNARDGGRC